MFRMNGNFLYMNMLSKFPNKSRLDIVDYSRGIALIAMTLFHFGWDLEMFGFADRGFASQPAMVWFARSIASSFLFLVGFSMVLAHQSEINTPAFAKRLAIVGGAAAMITIATLIFTPDIFIFFGILHHIALASVFCLLFLRLNAVLNFLAAATVILLFLYGRSALFDGPIWWWSGLNILVPRSSDYVPIFPFFAAVLFGIGAAKIALKSGFIERWSKFEFHSGSGKLLIFFGRHSLLYYLLHQPIMISFLYIFYKLTR